MMAIEQRTRTVLFSGHDFRFLKPFVNYCQGTPGYRVLLDEHQGHEPTHLERCRELLGQAELIFCEWCLGNAVWYSQHKKPGQRLVVRLHAQEMKLAYLERVRWDNVDALILICPLNYNLIGDRFPFLREKVHLVYNPIDVESLNQPKLPGAGFNLGILGISPMLKAPHLAFELLVRLKQIDRRFTLFVKGNHPRQYPWLWRRPEERSYYKRLFDEISRSAYSNSVVFETYGDDVATWFSKVGFILSTSDFEGSHQSVAEGMASGAVPIIRNWAGADAIYPKQYVFRSVDEAVRLVLKSGNPLAYAEETESCRIFARSHFDQSLICRKLEALLRGTTEVQRANLGSDRPLELECEPPKTLVLGYLPPGARGGYRIRIEQEIRTLKKTNCDVHLACLYPSNAGDAELVSHRTELEALGCPVHLVPVTGFFDIELKAAQIANTLEALETITSEHGLQIVHAEALYCARFGLLLKQRCRQLRLVFDCHGVTPAEERLSGAHPSRVNAMEEWEHRVLTQANLNVFVSEAMEDFFERQYGTLTAPHCTVPCCVSSERFPAENARSSLPIFGPNRPTLVYLGTMAPWQCGEEMIRLFAQLAEYDSEAFFGLLVPRNDHKKALTLMRKYDFPDDRVLLTELAHHQVPAALRQAHAGLLLRRDHPVNQVSSPTKFGEYLAAGLPVIMTDRIGDFSRMAAEEKLGLVLDSKLLDLQRYPSSELSRILDFVHSSMRRRQQISSRCRIAAHQHLGWDHASATLLEGYHRILADAGASAKGNAI